MREPGTLAAGKLELPAAEAAVLTANAVFDPLRRRGRSWIR